jgi:hypothetical protein
LKKFLFLVTAAILDEGHGPWMVPFQKVCPVIPTSNQDGRQAKNRKKGDAILIVHCCFSISQNEPKF